MAQEDDEARKRAAEARAAEADGDESERSEAANKGKKKDGWVAPAGDHSVFQPGEAGDPGDKGVEGYTQMPYDYR